MIKIMPLNPGFTSRIPMTPNTKGQQPYTDCTKLYSQAEIKAILERVGSPKCNIGSPQYTVSYYDKSGTLVINNKTITNDTTVISADGSVVHRGSHHNKEIASEGSFPDIVKDALERMGAQKQV